MHGPGGYLGGISTALLAVFAADLLSAPASAQNAAPDAAGIPADSIARNLPANGDPDGRRKALAERGITYGINYASDLQSNIAGGLRRRASYMGKLEVLVDIDLEKLSGLRGLSFHANAFQYHGHGLTGSSINSLMAVSYLEANASTRLSELWLEQKFAGDKATFRFGQLAADSEFFISSYGTQFINATFGWPAITGSNLPSGGPAAPLSTPGVRLKVDPDKSLSLLAAVFNGDPAGPGPGDPQVRNPHGLNFRVQDPPLVMGEMQYRVNQDKGDKGLAGSYKLGAWSHFGSFDDQRFGTDGLSLANPISNGRPIQLRGNHGVYGVIDQQIWRPPSGEPDKGVGLFARASASPDDRNLISGYVDGGIVFAGLIAARPDDVVSFGAAYAKISNRARGLDADSLAATGTGFVRNYEATFDANYQAQILPGWQMDLDLQRITHPSGGNIDATNPTAAAIPDATVLTLHTSIKY